MCKSAEEKFASKMISQQISVANKKYDLSTSLDTWSIVRIYTKQRDGANKLGGP